MNIDADYTETLSSSKTEAVFLSLTSLFLLCFILRSNKAGLDILAIVFLFTFLFFLFYAFNYRILSIKVAQGILTLRFGLFACKLPLAEIESADLDDISLWRIGGAGLHFTSIRRRYRAMFNFLEYPRVVVRLRTRRGPVRDVAFSTRYPAQVIHLLGGDTSSRTAA